MIESFLIALTGWPGILLSLALSFIGIARRKINLCLAGAILVFPFAYYLAGSPTFRIIGLLLPLFQFGVALAVRERRTKTAWLLLLPFLAIAGWLFVNII